MPVFLVPRSRSFHLVIVVPFLPTPWPTCFLPRPVSLSHPHTLSHPLHFLCLPRARHSPSRLAAIDGADGHGDATAALISPIGPSLVPDFTAPPRSSSVSATAYIAGARPDSAGGRSTAGGTTAAPSIGSAGIGVRSRTPRSSALAVSIPGFFANGNGGGGGDVNTPSHRQSSTATLPTDDSTPSPSVRFHDGSVPGGVDGGAMSSAVNGTTAGASSSSGGGGGGGGAYVPHLSSQLSPALRIHSPSAQAPVVQAHHKVFTPVALTGSGTAGIGGGGGGGGGCSVSGGGGAAPALVPSLKRTISAPMVFRHGGASAPSPVVAGGSLRTVPGVHRGFIGTAGVSTTPMSPSPGVFVHLVVLAAEGVVAAAAAAACLYSRVAEGEA